MTAFTHQDVISLAYFLPQFHPIPENDAWWGAGFTEWTQLNAARRYFPAQRIRQPHSSVGQYNLLDSHVMTKHWQTAQSYGIDGFLVFDYWFGQGKKLLEQPMQKVLEDDAELAYCFCWANHSWYNKRINQLLIQQQYLGEDDYAAYFASLLPHFQRPGYIKIANQLVFAIFSPAEVPDLAVFMQTFERLAKQAGFDGMFWLAENTDQHSVHAHRFDRYVRSNSMFRKRKKVHAWHYFKEKLTRHYGFHKLGPFQYDYSRLMALLDVEGGDDKTMPFAFCGWDTTPRHLQRGTWLSDFNPQTFAKQLARFLPVAIRQPGPCVILVKSWNEWAEGNVIEPDDVFGNALLEAFQKFVSQVKRERFLKQGFKARK